MKIKEWMYRYKAILKKIDKASEAIADIEAQIESVQGSGDGSPRGSGISDRTGRLAAQHADMVAWRMNLVYESNDIRDEIEKVIYKVEDEDCLTILYDRYIAGMTWEETAQDIYRSPTYTRGALHARALQMAEKVREKDETN